MIMGAQLNPKQMELSRLVSLGLSNSEAASALGISPWTVKHRLRRIYDTCGIWSRLELALWYVKHERGGPVA